MKTIKKCAGILLMLTILVGFASCQDDETLFDRLVGRTWVGDLGFSNREYPLESGIFLASNGFGEDELRYKDNGEFFGVLKLQWEISRGTLYISYAREAPTRELRNVYISNKRLCGSLYINGVYWDEVVLYMQ